MCSLLILANAVAHDDDAKQCAETVGNSVALTEDRTRSALILTRREYNSGFFAFAGTVTFQSLSVWTNRSYNSGACISLHFHVRGCTVPSSTDSSEETFEGSSGGIVSPNYPEDYHNNEYKLYKIIAPSLSKIVLTFIEFDVEYNYDCSYDSLKASTFSVFAVFYWRYLRGLERVGLRTNCKYLYRYDIQLFRYLFLISIYRKWLPLFAEPLNQ